MVRPPGSLVRYYLRAADLYGGVAIEPPGAPDRVYTFVTGPSVELERASVETNPGWSTVDPADNARTGRWERGDPIGTNNGTGFIQPEEDHTPAPGTLCYFTGNGPPGGGISVADVDDGGMVLLVTQTDVPVTMPVGMLHPKNPPETRPEMQTYLAGHELFRNFHPSAKEPHTTRRWLDRGEIEELITERRGR